MADYTQPEVAQKRVRFFDGQFLQDQDFIDEQKYHVDRERRMPRLLGVSGVVQGLVVSATGPFEVLVGRGAAVDDNGRQLVLAADTSLTLSAKFAKQQGVEVRLVYREQATDVAQTGGKSARRFDESPLVAAVAPDGSVAVSPTDAQTTWDGPSVLLAKLLVGDNGTVTADPSAQQPAGLAVPGVLSAGRAAAVGGFLSVAGHLAIGGTTAENAEVWERVVDLSAQWNAKLSVRAAGIDARLAVHNTGIYGAPAGMVTGTRSPHPLSVITGGATRMVVAASGNVGIGGAPGTPRLSVTGGGRDVVDLTVTGRIQSASAVGGMWVANQAFVGGVEPDGSKLGVFNAGQWRLTVGPTGHVGIGTGNGDVENAEGWDRVVDVVAANNVKLSMRTGTGNVDGRVMVHAKSVFGAAPGMLAGTRSNHPLSVITGGAQRMVVTADGNVGIGIQAPGQPSARLDVQGGGGGSIDLNVNGRLRSNNNDGGLWVAADRFVGGVETDKIGFYSGNGWRLAVDRLGNVSIGGTVVENSEGWARVLDVSGGSTTKVSVRTGNIDSRVMAHDSGFFGAPAGMVIGTRSNHPVSLATNGATHVVVGGNGNVGIGGPPGNPRLSVVGAGNDAVDLTVNGRIQSTSRVGGLWAGGNFVGGVEPDGTKIGMWANGSWRLTVASTGHVGIGTGVADVENSEGWERVVDIAANNHVKLSLRAGGIDGRVMVHNTGIYGGQAGMAVGTRSNHPFNVVTAGQNRMYVTAGGEIFFNQPIYFPIAAEWGGDNAPWPQTWDPIGSRRYYVFFRPRWNTNNNYPGVPEFQPRGFIPSDARLKQDVVELAGAVAKLERLRGVSFRWNEEGMRYLTSGIEEQFSAGPEASAEANRAVWDAVRQAGRPALSRRTLGVIAQDVEQVLPELVETDADGFKRVDYAKLNALLVQAVKEQQASIRHLQGRLETLEAAR